MMNCMAVFLRPSPPRRRGDGESLRKFKSLCLAEGGIRTINLWPYFIFRFIITEAQRNSPAPPRLRGYCIMHPASSFQHSAYYSFSNLNVCPPIEASYINPPFVWVNIITPSEYLAVPDAPSFTATADV